MTHRYNIDKDNGVWIFMPNDDVACVYQPWWPDGTPYASKAEAQAYAEAWIAAVDDNADVQPGFSPTEPLRPVIRDAG